MKNICRVAVILFFCLCLQCSINTNYYGAVSSNSAKSLDDKGARGFKKLNSFLICSANGLVLQRAPLFIHQTLFEMQYQKRENPTGVMDAMGTVLSHEEVNNLLDSFNELQSIYGKNFGWAIASKLSKAFSALGRDIDEPNARLINAYAHVFASLTLKGVLLQLGETTELTREPVKSMAVVENHPAVCNEYEGEV